MRIKFWKNKYALCIFLPFISSASVIWIITGICLMILKSPGYGGMIVGGAFPLIIIMLCVIFDQRLSSKVIYSDEGIEWERFKKKILFLKWEEITEVKTTPISMYSCYLSFVSDKGQIDVELTKKMYDAIMYICPEPNIKIQINELQAYKWYHREK